MANKHPIGWFEICVNDFEKAKDFYGNLFGWEFKLSKSTSGDYWNINTGDNSPGGGFMKKTEPSQNGQSIILYVETDDINSTLSRAEQLGGKIITSKTIISETSGYFALFNDLDGNLIGLWGRK